MNSDFDIQRFSIPAFTRNGLSITFNKELHFFTRLIEGAAGSIDQSFVNMEVTGLERTSLEGAPQAWLHILAVCRVPLVCQRCLQPVEQVLSFDREFRFVDTEALAEKEDEFSEEDVLVTSPQFDLLSLIEDELLMAMPLASMHVKCPVHVKSVAMDANFADEGIPKLNPFAVLANFKTEKNNK